MTDAELARFQAGALDPAGFPHREHARFGFELLRRYAFTEAAHRFARGLRAMADNAGHPERYHDTITVAFLSLIGERRAIDGGTGFAAFADAHPDLMRADALLDWYDVARLQSPIARRTFVLPRGGAQARVNPPAAP